MNKEEIIYPSMVVRSQAEAIEMLEKENKQLQNNWNELKEFVNGQLELTYLDLKFASGFVKVKDKMQEIESRK